MAAAVSDASVLIYLSAVQQFQLLREFYTSIIIPESVWRELTSGGSSMPGAQDVALAYEQGWLTVQNPRNDSLVASLRTMLDLGEAEAIALALEVGASSVLIDEREGRNQAKSLGLRVTGTLGILVRAKTTEKLKSVKPILDRLITRHGFRLNRRLYEEVLRQLGEIT